MRIHFCESCNQQFSSDGDLPSGTVLCESCREKRGDVPAARPGRTNALLRASTARGSHRNRSGGRVAVDTRGVPGLSPTVVWGGILALSAMVAVLLYAVYLMRSPSRAAKETTNPPQENGPAVTAPSEPAPGGKQEARGDEAAFDQLIAALDKLPPEDGAIRLSKLEDFVKRYPDSFYAPRARTMISTIQNKPGSKAK